VGVGGVNDVDELKLDSVIHRWCLTVSTGVGGRWKRIGLARQIGGGVVYSFASNEGLHTYDVKIPWPDEGGHGGRKMSK